jgi:hypothetical protein
MSLEAPPGALSLFLLAECLWFSSSLLLRLWLLLAFARPLLPLGLSIPIPLALCTLCVVIAPFFLAFTLYEKVWNFQLSQEQVHFPRRGPK